MSDPRRSRRSSDRPADDLVLPWYFSWWRVALLTAVMTLVIVAVASSVTSRPPSGDSVDVRFLQDMRTHHDQAVQMSLAYLTKTDTDNTLRTIAAEILLSQQQETGMMIETLSSFGAEEENSTGIGMEWMNQPVPLDRMPGMASDEELDQLEQAEGSEADLLFISLMTAHHEGGVLMAQYAAEHGSEGRLRDQAATTAIVQNEEIAELHRIRARLE